MILELTIYLLTTLIVVISLDAAIQIIKVQFAHDKHKKALNGLPILPRTWSVGGHMDQVYFTPYNCHKIEGLHRLQGRTFGFMYGTRPMVSTVDLDLIKKLALDGPKLNVNRTNLSIPVKVVQHHSIVYAQDDHWRQLRKAIAPGFM